MKTTEQELNILLKSLDFINYFPTSLNTTPTEYLKIHQRNIDTILNLSKERKSEYLRRKVINYDKISISEIEEFIKWKRKEISILDLVLGRILSFFVGIAKNKGNTRITIERKLNRISETNINLKKVIENPFLENIMEK